MNLSHACAGQNVGVTQVGDRIWLVTFMQYDLGYFGAEMCRLDLEPIDNPFGGPIVLPMCPGRNELLTRVSSQGAGNAPALVFARRRRSRGKSP